MRVLSSLQASVLQKPFSYYDRSFLCVSLLWPFRLETGEPLLEVEMWQSLQDFLKEGRMFDQSMPKDRGEFLCAGNFYAPRGKAVREEAVKVRVGQRSKILVVTGPREWRAGVMTRAEPITTLPIRYDQAFGGPGYPDNPVGKGYTTEAAGGESRHPLPCLEYPNEVVTSPSQTPNPGSLESLDMGWRPRQQYAGTYDEAYLRTRMPGLADDVDWRVFNDAAPDQWIDGFFAGTEDFEIVNMHPEKPHIRGALPGVVGRAFISQWESTQREPSFHEVPLRLDTVWLLPEQEIGVVVHRGTIGISEDDATDVAAILAAHENLSDARRPVSHYRDEMAKRNDPDEGYRYMLDTRPLLPNGCACASQELMASDAMNREDLRQHNLSTYAERQQSKAQSEADEQLAAARERVARHQAESPAGSDEIDRQLELLQGSGSTRETTEQEQEIQGIMERIAPGAASGGSLDLTKMDLGAFDDLEAFAERTGQEQRETAERQVRERIEELRRYNEPERDEINRAIGELESTLEKLDAPAPLPRVDLDAELARMREQLQGMEEYRQNLRDVGVDEAVIEQAMPSMDELTVQVRAAEQQIAEQYREVAHYIGPSLSPHPGEEPQRRADLLSAAQSSGSAAGGDYAFVDLSGVTLEDLDLSGAYLEYVDLRGAALRRVSLRGAILAKATLDHCRLEQVDLTDANVGSTRIEQAVFSECDFTRARLACARIGQARFERCRLLDRLEMFLEAERDRAQFIDCEMCQLNVVERDLSGCVFWGSDLTQSNFYRCDLTEADCSGTALDQVNVVSTRAPRAVFTRASMVNVRFVDDPVLNDCSLREADLTTANLRDADLAGADLSRARLEGADCSGADLSDASLDRSRAAGAQFRKAELAGASLYKADLREASLMKARLLRTRLIGTNLYSVSFLEATLGDTDFTGANLDNTILRDWRPSGG